ncbi:MAG: hypothetical protein K2H13_05850, partial [Eubacterium sp.]|nr:hypothetical protein [Eubacterium sp.]
MNKKNLKKAILYLIMIPFLIIILFVFSFIVQLFFGGYNYTSDIECVNSSKSFHIEEVVFKYENDKKEFIIYNDSNYDVCQSILKKREFLGETKYKHWISETAGPITYYTEWTEIDKNLRYICVDYENDIEDIDCQGFEPVGTKIYYT